MLLVSRMVRMAGLGTGDGLGDGSAGKVATAQVGRWIAAPR